MKKDYTFPWNVFPKPVPIDNYGISNKFIPIFSISGQEGYSDIPIPNYDDINLYRLTLDFKIKWDEKEINKAVFRGGPTGCGYTHTTNQRLMLLNMIENNNQEIKEKMLENFDVGIVSSTGEIGKSINNEIVKNDPKYGIGMMNTAFLSKDKINMTMQSNYKYIIHIDGNVNAYRLLISFLTGSLILRVKSQYTSWFEHLIHPFDIYDSSSTTENTHYILINEDFSNLLDIMEWCLRNDDKCKEIANNALEFAREKSRREYILLYISMILWSVNDKFSALYTKKSSSSVKTASSYNPSPHTPEEEQPFSNSVFQQGYYMPQQLSQQQLSPQQFIPQQLSPQQNMQQSYTPQQFIPQQNMQQSYTPQQLSPQQFIPQSPSNSPPPTPPLPTEGFRPLTPPTPPTPTEGFSPPPPPISPQMTDILTQLKSINEELKEKESTGGSIEESEDSIEDANNTNIFDVEKDKTPEGEEYIKGGNTKKIKLI